MKKTYIMFINLIIVFLLIASFAFAQKEDRAGSKDHPLFTRMPNFYINNYLEYEFDAHEFESEKEGKVTIEGHKYKISYVLQPGAKNPSALQILRNYGNAIKKIGGTVEKESIRTASLKYKDDEREIWTYVWVTATASRYDLTIVEKEEMVQDVVASPETSERFARDIRINGKTTIYGIYFDTDKTEIKPESEPALKEISNLLSQNTDLKIYVVGHTDNTGELEYNMELSLSRAKSVVNYLIDNYNIEIDRLVYHGVGPLSPVASNKTEEGRAKNRRVELIEQ
ncbi:OmpA family protein [Candidatus Poribacteria bacterium]|nr:OmpA family protein [Candidatus Poribacteria bacterium]